MTNHNSNVGYVPTRTCIICKKKTDQKALLGFYMLQNEMVFDVHKLVPTRKKYVCHAAACLELLDKWLDRQRKKSNRIKR
jgi:predicted RNA-binding protein YlxR (DUF448 family)